MKRGNRPEGPRGAKGGTGSRNRWRERWRRHQTSENRLNETRTDSEAGEAKRPSMAFTTLAHHIDIDWLREAYRRTRKDGATGVDGQTAERVRSEPGGQPPVAARPREVRHVPAPPVRRVHIPKGKRRKRGRSASRPSRTRSCSARSRWCWRPSTSRTFCDCSYGFRPGRSAHQALEALCETDDGDGRRLGPGGRHPEVLRHAWTTGTLREMLRRRVRDGVLLRLIGKWLNAGVLEDGALTYPEAGTPQGGVISPTAGEHLPARGARRVVRARGAAAARRVARLVRYADDAVMVFSQKRRMRAG